MTGSEKTTLIAHFHKTFFGDRTKGLYNMVYSLQFVQARSPFRCEVMIANAGAVPLRLT